MWQMILCASGGADDGSQCGGLGGAAAARDRRLVLPLRVGKWSRSSLQQRLVKTGGRLIQHARYHRLLLAEGHLTRRLFGAMVRGMGALPAPAG